MARATTLLRSSLIGGVLGILELFFAPPVTAAFDERAGGGEIVAGTAGVTVGIGVPWVGCDRVEESGAVEMDIGEKQPHGPAFSDLRTKALRVVARKRA